MSVLDDLTILLQDNGLGVISSTIFLGVVPSQPESFLVLTEEYGFNVYYTLEEPQIRYEEPRLIFLSKDPSYAVAREKAEQCYRLFGSIHNQQINNIFYMRIMPEHPPYFFEIDPQRNCFIGFYLSVLKYVV